MANNRIYLGCVECMEEGLADSIIQLAKYYPSSGWYPYGPSLAEWMDRHSHYMSDEGCDDQKRPPFMLYYEDSIPTEIWEARSKLWDARQRAEEATTSPADTSPPASAPSSEDR